MKKITSIALLFALNWQICAQNAETSNLKRNELKLDISHLLVPAIKIEYEYFLNEMSSLGVAGLHNFGTFAWGGLGYTTQLFGTYRLYVTNLPMYGFFLEGHLGLVSGKYDERVIWPTQPKEISYSAFGMGIALGWKFYIPKSGITLDLFSGLGRMFGENIPHLLEGLYPRAGICIGKRF
jgi:hypothetical protein